MTHKHTHVYDLRLRVVYMTCGFECGYECGYEYGYKCGYELCMTCGYEFKTL